MDVRYRRTVARCLEQASVDIVTGMAKAWLSFRAIDIANS